ncbi:MAG TPA: hypothetical protein VF810_03775 [Patescibacteria group bacterium]
MITIIHGTDTAASRNYFFAEKDKHEHAHLLDGEKTQLTDLMQIFEGGGLFMESKTVFMENFFNKKKQKEEFKILSTYLEKQSAHQIFLWENKELDKGAQLAFKKAVLRVFKLPQTLFLFLDNLMPSNSKQLLSLFHQTIALTDTEMVFFMLVRQIRILLSLQSSSETSIDELKRLAPWQKAKLVQQAAMFGEDRLKELHNQLFKLEIGQKTGGLASSLAVNIDFLLLEL